MTDVKTETSQESVSRLENAAAQFPSVATMTDPHMQPYAKHPGRAEGIAGLFLLLGVLGFAGFGAAYFVNANTQWLGVTLGVGLFSFGIGLATWGKYLLPQGPFTEERHQLASTQAERDAMAAAIVERGTMVVKRRRVLTGLLGLGGAVMGIVLAFPLIRSLGPVPKKSLFVTNWKAGVRLVDVNGNPVTVDALLPNGALVVFPEGHSPADDDFSGTTSTGTDQVFLLRPGFPYDPEGDYPNMVTAPDRATWGPQGYLAFSKLCTHAGCPVGLFQHETQQLLCPCHQSLFNVRAPENAPPGVNASPAVPVFGPAPRPLPQLPLGIDSDGKTLIATGGFSEPVGPGFWERP